MKHWNGFPGDCGLPVLFLRISYMNVLIYENIYIVKLVLCSKDELEDISCSS